MWKNINTTHITPKEKEVDVVYIWCDSSHFEYIKNILLYISEIILK